jgi:hypothetical protein
MTECAWHQPSCGSAVGWAGVVDGAVGEVDRELAVGAELQVPAGVVDLGVVVGADRAPLRRWAPSSRAVSRISSRKAGLTSFQSFTWHASTASARSCGDMRSISAAVMIFLGGPTSSILRDSDSPSDGNLSPRPPHVRWIRCNACPRYAVTDQVRQWSHHGRTVGDVLMNLYLVMLQRYNRAKLAERFHLASL